jgi:hypothetical protein
MSNIFGKQLLKDLLSNTTSTESSFNLPKYVTINEKKLNDSITSAFVQNGGSMGLSSAKENTEAEINQLISMLTSESSEVNNNSTETVALENKLKNMLQEGGARKKRTQRGGANDEVRNACEVLKRNGIKVKECGDSESLNIFTPNSSSNSESSILGGILKPKDNNETSSINNVLSPSKMSPTSEVPAGPSKRITPTKINDSATSSAVPVTVADTTTSEMNALFIPSSSSKKLGNNSTSSAVPNIPVNDLSTTSVSVKLNKENSSATSSAIPNIPSNELSATSVVGSSKKNKDLSATSSEVPNIATSDVSATSVVGSSKKSKDNSSVTSSEVPNVSGNLSPTSVSSPGSSANTTTSVGNRSLLDVLGDTVSNGFRTLGKIFEDDKKTTTIKGGAKKNSKRASKKGSKKNSKKMNGGAKKNSKNAKKGKGRK